MIDCSTCHREIQHGEDVLALERGVIGPRGYIPLDEPQYFCSEHCLYRPDEEDDRLP
jgi:hypothetical protein